MSGRAMSIAVSGLRDQQVLLDVIANNISNSSTTAFKGSRLTFKESFAVVLQGASNPPGDQGGVNPLQVGNGSAIGSIDSQLDQGTLESTGNDTDIAISGDGFFVISDGQRYYYTRAGSFQWDSDGTLVTPTNGMAVQGRIADSTGYVSDGSPLGSIQVGFGTVDPAKATTYVTLSGNLDSAAEPVGNIVQSKRVYAREISGETRNINGLYANGTADTQITGLTSMSTTVTVSASDSASGALSKTYTYVAEDTGAGNQDFHTLDDLIAEINDDFSGDNMSMTAALDSNGALQFTNLGATSNSLTLSSVNSTLNTALAVANGTVGLKTTDAFSHVASATDKLIDLRNSKGDDLGLTLTDTVTVDGRVGGNAITTGSISVDNGEGVSITYGEYVQKLKDVFGITNSAGVEIDSTSGALVVNADGGADHEISAMNISASGVEGFNKVYDATVGNWTETRTAKDSTHSASVEVYDSLGNVHNLNINFTKDSTSSNAWNWTISVPEPAEVSGGYSGTIAFDAEGNLQSCIYSQGASSFTFDPKNGADVPVEIAFDFGTIGSADGITQFANDSTVIAQDQDGYSSGTLEDTSISSDGTLTGEFSNGVTRTLARLVLGTFNNSAGLERIGDNLYSVSANSGQAIIGFAGTSIDATITPGALESSNVDLAEEFTNMIVAQRTYQANARTVTTADELLQETVNLKR